MKLLWKSLSSCSVTLLDAACVWALLALPLEPRRVVGVVVAHALFTFVGALSLLIGAPASVRRARFWFVGFAWAISFFLPVVAPVGLLLAQVVGLAAHRRVVEQPWVVLAIDEELAAEPVAPHKRQVSATRIANLLRDRSPATAERRFQAILLVKHLAPRTAIAILKQALKDPSDEVRLFAFARIEKVRDELETQIKQLSAQVPTARGDALPTLHLRIAESYFEIAYLGLAEGAVLAHALDSAHEHASKAVQLRQQFAPAEYLLGRILLQKRELSWALKAFERAVQAGYSRTKALPYMAECAFKQRRYEQVRSLLRDLEMTERLPSKVLQPVLDFWR